MKAGLKHYIVMALVLAGAVGCGNDTATLSAGNKLFQTADPQIKAQWAEAAAAIETNGFLTAMLSLQKLQRASLTPEQLAAVNATATRVSNDMYDAANKGDASASEAIAKLRKLQAR